MIILAIAATALFLIVLQHNLLSTATDAERRATRERLINWWNYVAVPVLPAPAQVQVDGEPAADWARPLIEELRLPADLRPLG